MRITWQDLEGVIKRSGKRERERVAVLTAGHKFNVNPGRYRFLLSSVRGSGPRLDRPPPRSFFFFYDRVQPPDKKPHVKSSHGVSIHLFARALTSLPGNTDLLAFFFPPRHIEKSDAEKSSGTLLMETWKGDQSSMERNHLSPSLSFR